MRFAALLLLAATLPAADTLDIYAIDVEGGKAMIVRGPSGQTMMIDGGMPNARDLARVAAAADALNIKQFDAYLVTHYDVDHVGNHGDASAHDHTRLLARLGARGIGARRALPHARQAAGLRRRRGRRIRAAAPVHPVRRARRDSPGRVSGP